MEKGERVRHWGFSPHFQHRIVKKSNRKRLSSPWREQFLFAFILEIQEHLGLALHERKEKLLCHFIRKC